MSKYVGNNQFSEKSETERFWEKVSLFPGDVCWNWLGAKGHKDYGYFHANSGMTRAHRYSWILHYGNIPTGMFVCHKCDNPSCVNPKHLFLGTHKDNMNDMKHKNRHKGKGSKLSDSDVLEIRKLLSDGISCADLSKNYGVSKRTIYSIKNKESWSHI